MGGGGPLLWLRVVFVGGLEGLGISVVPSCTLEEFRGFDQKVYGQS